MAWSANARQASAVSRHNRAGSVYKQHKTMRFGRQVVHTTWTIHRTASGARVKAAKRR